MKDSNKTLAVFDFDGTITYRDTLISFLFYVAGPFKTCLNLFLELPILIGFALGLVTRQQTKERVLKRFFNGWSLTEIRGKGKEFALKQLDRYVRPEAFERIKWHQNQGHRCILISASLDVYLQPWTEKMGFEAIISSRFEATHDGKVTGQLKGLNCWGPEKVRRLTEALGSWKEYCLYAYGDSRGDQELLETADYPFYRQMPAGEVV